MLKFRYRQDMQHTTSKTKQNDSMLLRRINTRQLCQYKLIVDNRRVC